MAPCRYFRRGFWPSARLKRLRSTTSRPDRMPTGCTCPCASCCAPRSKFCKCALNPVKLDLYAAFCKWYAGEWAGLYTSPNLRPKDNPGPEILRTSSPHPKARKPQLTRDQRCNNLFMHSMNHTDEEIAKHLSTQYEMRISLRQVLYTI